MSATPDRAAEARRAREIEQYRSALDELGASALHVSEVFQRVAASGPGGKAHVDAGGRVSDIPIAIELRDLRAEIDEALDRFNEARLATRIWTARLALEEGTSLGEMGRLFGVSRQYLSKLLRAHEDELEPPS